MDDTVATRKQNGLLDVCPFTVIGTFSCGLTDINRKAVAAELGNAMEIDDALLKALAETFGNENDCPCCCHDEEEVECMRDHGESGCCVVSEYTELDHCCY